MKANGLLAPSRVGSPRGPRTHDGTIIPERVDTMWGDRPDHHLDRRGPGRGLRRRRSLLGRVRRHPRGPPGHPLRGAGATPAGRASLLWRVRERRRPRPLAPPRPREPIHVRPLPEGTRLPRRRELARLHPVSGRQWLCGAFHRTLPIRTLKENLLWVRTFNTVEELRQALLDFRETYNANWLIERHGFRPPSAIRQDQLSPAALAA